MQQISFVVYSRFSENNARFPPLRESRYMFVVAVLLIVALFQAPGGSRLCLVFVRCYTGVHMSYYPHTIVSYWPISKPAITFIIHFCGHLILEPC